MQRVPDHNSISQGWGPNEGYKRKVLPSELQAVFFCLVHSTVSSISCAELIHMGFKEDGRTKKSFQEAMLLMLSLSQH